MDPMLNARCESMSDNESMSDDDLPEYKCTVRADERSRLFKPGYRCPESMTYWELCEYMTTESNKAGFDPLRPKIVSKSRLLDYVIFYCVHSRDHGDQSREAKGLAEAQSKRANRSEEATRCLNTGCSFEIRMIRTKDIELVSVASIQTIILAVFKVMLSDYQVSCVF